MSDIAQLIASGILEMYVAGLTTPEETQEVEKMMAISEEVRKEIDTISEKLEIYAQANAVVPDPAIKHFLLATLRYIERLQSGEAPTFPPLLHPGSKIEDYIQWLDRPELQLNEQLNGIYAHVIGHTPELTTVIAWLQYGSPPEVHTSEYEKFLIVEGTCDITIGDTLHQLSAGDVLEIPLHVNHWVVVTSDIPCKVVLQRQAA